MKICIINGPNLNLLGKGNLKFMEIKLLKITCYPKDKFPMIEITYFQSNIEGELIDKIQELGFTYDGIILNAGAYTHTSIAIGDAIKAITTCY
jgi:3-dehydroquinate dehydratase-2